MKAKTISKRVLSVILCTVMLFSCWVFTAPTADAAGYSNVNAGKYYLRVYWNTTNTKDDSDCWYRVYYRHQDGTGGSDYASTTKTTKKLSS